MNICLTARLIVLLALVYLLGCNSMNNSSSIDSIVCKGTTAYDNEVASLRVTPEDAASRLIRYMILEGTIESDNKPSTERMMGGHHLIVNGSYLFLAMPIKNGLSLDGYYVDGATGQVDLRNEQGKLTVADIRKRGWDQLIRD